MFFSVVVPTCNRPEALALCLARLEIGAQSLPASEYEVIVTDDGSKEPAEGTLRTRFPAVRWTTGPRSGPAANRNHGASIARGEWLAFTDDDCLPDPQWLEAFARRRGTNPSARVIEGLTYVDRPRRHPLEFSPVNLSGGYLWACNFAIERRLFVQLCGFDERFPFNAMEDVEFARRLQAQGIRPVFESDASVLHPWRLVCPWIEHDRRHRASRLLIETIHPGSGFPVSWPRVLRTHARAVLQEHLPMLVRRPISTGGSFPMLWRSMIWDIWAAWRYHKVDPKG